MSMFMPWILAMVAGPAAAQMAGDSPAPPVVAIETGAHQGFINRIVALDGDQLLTISDDQTARRWNSRGELRDVIRGQAGLRDEGAVYAVATSSRLIALGGRAGVASGKPFIRFLDRHTLVPVGVLGNLPDMVTALAFNADGSRLAIGFARAGVRVYAWGNGTPVLTLSTQGTVNDIAFLADGRIAVSSDDLAILNGDGSVAARPVLPADFHPFRLSIAANGRSLAIGAQGKASARIFLTADWSAHDCAIAASAGMAAAVAWDRDILIVGGRDDQGGVIGRCDAGGRSLATQRVGAAPVTAVAAGPSGAYFGDSEGDWGTWSGSGVPHLSSRPIKLRFRSVGIVPIAASDDGLQVRLASDGRPYATLDLATRSARQLTSADFAAPDAVMPEARNLEPGETPLSSTRLAGSGALLATNYYLRRIDGAGRTMWKAPGGSPFWGAAIAAKAGLVVAVQGNGTVSWHRLDTGRLVFQAYVSPKLDWVGWTPDGFFDRGGGAATTVGHLIDRGAKQGSEWVSLAQTSSRYFRPDLVLAALSGRPDDERMLARARATTGVASTRLTSHGAPVLTLDSVCGVDADTKAASTCFAGAAAGGPLNIRKLVTASTVDVTFTLQGSDGGATRLRVNGAVVVPQSEKKLPVEGGERRRIRVELPSGDSRIEVSVANADGTAFSRSVLAQVTGVAGVPGTGRLLVMSVGISSYQLAAFSLAGGVASNDARRLASTVGSPSNHAYLSEPPLVFTDGQSTRQAILDGLAALASRATANDFVVIFFAGHGAQVDGDYVFAPYEIGTHSAARIADARAGKAFADEALSDIFRQDGLAQGQIGEALARIKASRVLVVLDTCYSGSFDALGGTQQATLSAGMGERFAENSGRYVIASSRGKALDNAMASTDGAPNSIFTGTLMRGVAGAADSDGDGIVTLAELGDYVRKEVPKEAQKFKVQQAPVIAFYGDPFFPVFQKANGVRK